MSDKRIRFEYRGASSHDYVVKLRNRRHYIYNRHYGLFGNTDKPLGDASSLEEAISFLKATAKSGYFHIEIKDV